MPKKRIFLLSLLMPFVLASAAESADLKKLVIGPLKNQTIDAGCVLELRNPKGREPMLFFSGADGTWMNFDNQDVKLIELHPTEPENLIYRYRYEDITISVAYGKGREQEGGISYDRSKITLTQNGFTRVIPAKGGCGC